LDLRPVEIRQRFAIAVCAEDRDQSRAARFLELQERCGKALVKTLVSTMEFPLRGRLTTDLSSTPAGGGSLFS
jgi:hypothetical protein